MLPHMTYFRSEGMCVGALVAQLLGLGGIPLRIRSIVTGAVRLAL